MWDIVTAVVSTLVGTAVLGGLMIRYALLPYMKSQLIDPVITQLATIGQIANDAMSQVRIIGNMWDGHQEWSQREVDRIWAELMRSERVSRRQGQ